MTAALAPLLFSRLAGLAEKVTTPLSPSHFIELAFPLAATHTRYARVIAVTRETRDTASLTLRPGRGFERHSAGQWVRVGAAVAGRLVTRTYSITSAPERSLKNITITVRAVAGGRLSNHLVRAARAGDHLTIGQPEGDFVIPERGASRILFITGGSGITPVMSMLRSFEARGEMPDVVHVHYAPTKEESLFRTELLRLAAEFPRFQLHLITTREVGPDGDQRRFDLETLQRFAPDFADRTAFACGPEGLVRAAESCFDNVGEAALLRVERFHRGTTIRNTTGLDAVVRFGLSAKEIRASAGSTLLDAAERAGVCAPSGCRMGICHSCDTTLVSGRVRDLRSGRVEQEPGSRVQLCVCAADGDVDLAL